MGVEHRLPASVHMLFRLPKFANNINRLQGGKPVFFALQSATDYGILF